jgi:hypothetical protein
MTLARWTEFRTRLLTKPSADKPIMTTTHTAAEIHVRGGRIVDALGSWWMA